MTIKYSASERGFFDTALHRDIPDDAVKVTAKRHADLLAGQAQGLEIVPDDCGRPGLKRIEPSNAVNARAIKLRAIKREAARRIDRCMPIWKQLNALRDSSDPGFWQIDAIRSASDLIESELAVLKKFEAITAFPVTDNPLWPVFDSSEIDS